jgi:ribonuclease HI
MSELYEGYFDGSAIPNPGQRKIGGYIKKVSDKEVFHKYSIDLGYGTNNEAEYMSLIELCGNLKKFGITSINIYGDSLLVINQINSVWKARDPRMESFKVTALDLLKPIPNWTLTHVRRNMNMLADSLTR